MQVDGTGVHVLHVTAASRAGSVSPDQNGRETLVLLHGFPTSCWDWHAIEPALSSKFDLLMMDYPGFGLSDKPTRRSYSLIRQFDAVNAVLRAKQIERCRVLCHDMGNTVLCEWLFALQEGRGVPEITRIDMLNGGVYMDLHRPLFTQRLLRTPGLGEIAARLSSRAVFNRQYPKVYARPDQFDAVHYDGQWALMTHHHGRRVWAKTAIYMRERVRYIDRWQGSLHTADIPVRLIWGRLDPIAVAAIAERLQSSLRNSRLYWLDGCGHYPQLEQPEAVAEIILAE